MALNYLLDPMFQIENSAGKPATDGWLEVYVHGTREKYYCASNFDGTLHPFKIKLDSLGSNIVLAEDYQSYDVYAYNRFGSLLMSRYNVQPGSGGGGGIVTGEMQHWLGMYGPTYTNFPGDLAGHTLGIPRQSVDYVGDFIDRIENTSYPDGDVPAYIYLKPGLYHIDCVIRYQQDTGDIKNTLDEVLVYTGHGNANEDVAYQLDASGPETNGNRHCLKQSFIRKVTDSDGEVLYFAPGTPTDWTDAYIQTLNIVKLDSFALNGATMLSKVHHDETMTGDGTPDNPLSIQDALDGKQDTLTGGNGITIINNIVNIDSDSVQEKLTPGEGITIDSDGVISTEGRMYTEGWGIDIDNDNNVISADPEEVQKKLTAGDNINIDSDGVISATVPETAQADWTETDSSDPSYIQNKPTPKTLEAGSGVTITEGQDSITISAEGRMYTAGQNIEIDSDGVISAELPEEEEVEFEEIDLDDYQTKLTAGQNITIDSDGVISAETSENNLFIAHVNETTYDEIKAALDAGKIVVALDGRIQFTVCSNWTDMWSQPAVLFGRMTDQYQGGFPARTLWSCRKDGNNTVWTRHYNNDALASKSDLNNKQDKLTAGDGITIINNIISVDSDSVQEKLTAGEGINIDSDGTISVDLPPITPLIAGDGVTIVDSQEGVVISAEGRSYTAGEGITIDSDGVISVDLPPVAPLVAGDNISIVDSDGSVVISATGGGSSYTAGTGIDINSDGIISVDPSTVAMQSDLPEEEEVEFEEIDLDDYQTKLTAGQNITIDSDGVISATGGGGTQVQSDWDEEDSEEPSYIQNKPTPKTLVAGQNVTITESSNAITISAADAPTYTAGQNIEIDSDGVISAELPDEEEVDFEEVDLDDYQTKLTAGSGINIDSDGIISNTMTVDQTYDATSSNPQSGTAVAEAISTKEDEFNAGDGLEFITDSDGNRVLQVEGPVDVVAGPGIVIDNPDGNTLRISASLAWIDKSSEISGSKGDTKLYYMPTTGLCFLNIIWTGNTSTQNVFGTISSAYRPSSSIITCSAMLNNNTYCRGFVESDGKITVGTSAAATNVGVRLTAMWIVGK